MGDTIVFATETDTKKITTTTSSPPKCSIVALEDNCNCSSRRCKSPEAKTRLHSSGEEEHGEEKAGGVWRKLSAKLYIVSVALLAAVVVNVVGLGLMFKMRSDCIRDGHHANDDDKGADLFFLSR